MTPLDVVSENYSRISVDFNQAHALSVGLFESMEAQEAQVSTGVVAILLTLARLLAPQEQTDDEEVAFVQAALDWTAAYFTEGSVN